jgi:hypothetical protein
MSHRHSIWSKVAVVVALASVVLLAGDQAMASNMGFKMNKTIAAIASPSPIGENRVALPYRNPYNNAQDICTALGLTAATGSVRQLDPASGVTAVHNCGAAGPFGLTLRLGVIVRNPTAVSGILVGSHSSNPPGGITIRKLGSPSPIGQNDFPVPYHTTAVTAEDICVDLGLPATSIVRRLDASSGVTSVHNCGAAGPYNVVLGESLRISMPSSVVTDLVVASGHPAHF